MRKLRGKFAEISRKFAENFVQWPLPEQPHKWIAELLTQKKSKVINFAKITFLRRNSWFGQGSLKHQRFPEWSWRSFRRNWWRTSGEVWQEIFELLLLGKIVRSIFHRNSTANFTIKLHYEVLGCGGPYFFGSCQVHAISMPRNHKHLWPSTDTVWTEICKFTVFKYNSKN